MPWSLPLGKTSASDAVRKTLRYPGKQLGNFGSDVVTGVIKFRISQLINQPDRVKGGDNLLLLDASGIGKPHLARSTVTV